MEYPMRVYGLNIFERVLADLLTAISWLLILFSIAAIIFKDIFYQDAVYGTILIACTILTGILLGLAGGGVRQNRTALIYGLLFMFLTGAGWIVNGFFPLKWGSLIAGEVILLLLSISRMLRKRGFRARFNSRFFSIRQFETMIQVADTMMDTDGKGVVSPIAIAVKADHMMAKMDPPVTQNIRKVVFRVEWLLPILIFRPFPFSMLGSNQRRRLVQKVTGARGIFKDVAQSLKMLTG